MYIHGYTYVSGGLLHLFKRPPNILSYMLFYICIDGAAVGDSVGAAVGAAVGDPSDDVGDSDGFAVGAADGAAAGTSSVKSIIMYIHICIYSLFLLPCCSDWRPPFSGDLLHVDVDIFWSS